MKASIVEVCKRRNFNRWLAVDEAPSSGAATLEVELPSGYALVQSDANQLVENNEFAFVRDVLVGPHKVVWLFDKVLLANLIHIKQFSLLSIDRLARKDIA